MRFCAEFLLQKTRCLVCQSRLKCILLPGMGIPNHKVVRHENFSGFICVQTELVYFIWISLANCGWDLANCGWNLADCGWFLAKCGWDLANGGWNINDCGLYLANGEWDLDECGWDLASNWWNLPDFAWYLANCGWDLANFTVEEI